MRCRAKKGMILTFVIVALALTGAVMFVLSEGSNTMLFRADTAYLEAVERNLIASGLAWAGQKTSGDTDPVMAQPLELNGAGFGPPRARLTVQVLQVHDDMMTVHIETSCSKGRRTLETSRKYTIQTEPAM